ncbi:hypothetical protein LZU85_03335 [Vibrio sp. IRLE0018]|uniref:hypothetical protein n=1 Tax=Vibrio floridensis TaxID=2908007 RepID=UPI001A361316|nr:hypothetical protein [Vibrio floridensis]MCF8777824.1 hypothetical protein [Vibrio floridensis]HAS6346981.1 hypothetical protein [Vibrio vulnificus]
MNHHLLYNLDLIPFLEQISKLELRFNAGEPSYARCEQEKLLSIENVTSIGVIENGALRSFLQVALVTEKQFGLLCNGNISEYELLTRNSEERTHVLYFATVYCGNHLDGSRLIDALLNTIDASKMADINYSFAIINMLRSTRHLQRFGFKRIEKTYQNHSFIYVIAGNQWLNNYRNSLTVQRCLA